MRTELVDSAISFLQDPTVAASPLEKRVAFLKSKNLTQEEIDASLQRVGESAAAISTAIATVPAASPPPASYRSPYASSYYGPQQKQPPELPARDWRDWFIMATVTSGVSYGLYFLAKRYVVPLIAPPTPPALESDKAAITTKFDEAFQLLDTLKTDTAALKSAEEERKARVDAALQEVEEIAQNLKDAGKRREDESKRVGDEVRGLRDLIPKALEGQKEAQKRSLEELQTELKSLKQLVVNRTQAQRTYVPPGGGSMSSGTPPLDPGAAAAAANRDAAGAQTTTAATQQALGTGGNALGGLATKSPLPFGVGSPGAAKPSIPAWQMAARAQSVGPGPVTAAPPTPPPVNGTSTNGEAKGEAAASG